MQFSLNKSFPEITYNKVFDALFFISGFTIFLYSCLPFRFWEKFFFPNQIETIIIAAYISIAISGCLFLRFVLNRSREDLKINKIDILLLIFVVYLSCRYLLQAQNINHEFAFEGFSLIILYIFFRCLKHSIINYILLLFPLIGVAQVIYGIKIQTDFFEQGYGLSDVMGGFNNTGIFGGFIAVISVVTVGLLVYLSDLFDLNKGLINYCKLLLCLVLILLLIQLFSTHSRAAVLSVFLGTFCLIENRFNLFHKYKDLPWFKGIVYLLLFICCFSLLLYGMYHFKKDSAEGRIAIWKISWTMIKDKPLLGHGINGFQTNYMDYQGNYFKQNPASPYAYLADDNHYAFNEFLKVWVEFGILGLILLLTILYHLLFCKNNGKRSREIFIAKASILALILFSFFSYPVSVFQFGLIAAFFTAIISKSSNEEIERIESISIKIKDFRKALPSIAFFLWAIFAMILIFPLYNYSRACNKWDRALKGFKHQNNTTSIEMLKNIYPELKNNGIFLSTYGKALNESDQYDKANLVLQRAIEYLPSASNYIELGKSYRALGDSMKASESWSTASFMVPSKFTPGYLKVQMLFDNGKFKDAMLLAEKLLNKRIKIWTPALQYMKDDLNKMINSRAIKE